MNHELQHYEDILIYINSLLEIFNELDQSNNRTINTKIKDNYISITRTKQ